MKRLLPFFCRVWQLGRSWAHYCPLQVALEPPFSFISIQSLLVRLHTCDTRVNTLHTHTRVCNGAAFGLAASRLIVYNHAGQLPSLVFQHVSTSVAAILCYKSLILIERIRTKASQKKPLFSLRSILASIITHQLSVPCNFHLWDVSARCSADEKERRAHPNPGPFQNNLKPRCGEKRGFPTPKRGGG